MSYPLIQCYACGKTIKPNPDGQQCWFRAVLPANRIRTAIVAPTTSIQSAATVCWSIQFYVKFDGNLFGTSRTLQVQTVQS